jgi:hypothetical protein
LYFVVNLAPVVEELMSHVPKILNTWKRKDKLGELVLDRDKVLILLRYRGNNRKNLQCDRPHTRLDQIVLMVVEFDCHLVERKRTKHRILRIIK